MIPALTEIMPAEVRVAGFAGLQPGDRGWRLHAGNFTARLSTGDKASPGYWMSFAAICGLLATCTRSAAAARQRQRVVREVTVMISGGFSGAGKAGPGVENKPATTSW